MEGLSSLEGWALIATYFVAMMMLVVFLRKHKKTKEEFLVANRSMPWLLTAFSMAATWVWAPSMFVASEKAYTRFSRCVLVCSSECSYIDSVCFLCQ